MSSRTETSDAQVHERPRWWRARRALVVALVLSALVHAALSFLPDELPTTPDSTPLSATIRELPPPPPIAKAPPPAPKPKPRPRPKPAPPPAPVVAPEPTPEPLPPDDLGAQATDTAAAEPAPASEPPGAAGPPEPPVLAEEVTAPAEAIVVPKALPPRVDLAYKVFYGLGFHVGNATYRFEHEGNRYAIATVGEARGLAALFVRGRGRVESRGVITATGLQPMLLEVDKFNRHGSERAEFDWDIGIATLHENKVEALELPTFDPLTMLWQFYFQPPAGDSMTFAVATTRRLHRVTIRRERLETMQWGDTQVVTEVWRRTSEDGLTESYLWLAPSLQYVPLKMRAEHTTRGTVEAVLDAIRVDEPVAQARAEPATQ